MQLFNDESESTDESESSDDVVETGKCGKDLTYTITGDETNGYTLTISGTGEMYNFWSSDAPWSMKKKAIVRVSIEGDVTFIGSNAFEGCSNLTNVTIPEGVTSIGGSAFFGCSNLTNVTIPEGVTSIGGSAFFGCSSLTNISLPEGITSIGSCAFKGCSSLTNISLPDGITSIKLHTFYGCSSLTNINLPEGIMSIDSGAFSGCSSLTNISLPEGITSIDSGAFSGCSSLTNISLPDGITSIGSSVFFGCSSLTNITLPEGIRYINYFAFLGCSNLKIVKYIGSEKQWKEVDVSSEEINNAVIYYNYDPNHTHLYGMKTVKEATCIERGEKLAVCTLCGESYTEEIPATGHKEIKDNAVSATCTQSGKTEGSHCSVCGKVIIEQTDIPSLGHLWDSGSIVKESTCRATGENLYTCSRCGETKTETIPKIDHTIVIDEAIEATCVQNGKTEGSHCSVCGTVIQPQIDIPGIGHLWDEGTISKEAGCTENGEKTYICKRCNEIETEEIPATGHTIVTDPAVEETCTTPGKTEGKYCSVCGKVITVQEEIPAIGHNWREWKITKLAGVIEEGERQRTCTRCEEIDTEVISKTEPIQTTPPRYTQTIVNDCVYIDTSMTLTDFSFSQNVVVKKGCTLTLYGNNIFHKNVYVFGRVENYGNVNINEKLCCLKFNNWLSAGNYDYGKFYNYGGCKTDTLYVRDDYLNYYYVQTGEQIPVCNHEWTDLEIITNTTCTIPGRGKKECSLCGKTAIEEIPATGHTKVVDAAISATCTQTGKTEGSHCSVCGIVLKSQTTISALGHSWDNGKITKGATCTKNGEKTYTCTRCNNTKTDVIPATGHKEIKDSAISATCTQSGKTEGSHCSVCGTVLKEQKVIPATGHHYDSWKTVKAATACAKGKKERSCTNCGKTETKTIPKLKATIKLSSTKKTVRKNKSYTLKVTKLAKGDMVKSVKSSKKSVATVKKLKTNQYKITGKKKGTANITVILKSGKKAICKITVK